jgi:SAM-dependent methyltransferase
MRASKPRLSHDDARRALIWTHSSRFGSNFSSAASKTLRVRSCRSIRYAAAVEVVHRESAEWVRQRLLKGELPSSVFRAALLCVPESERDVWLDVVLDLHELSTEEGPELPRGCVPYVPCSVDAVLRAIELAGVQASDVFVDIGAGVGRAAALVQLLTGASAVCLEIQASLVRATRDLAKRVKLARVTVLEGDAADLTLGITSGSVFFLYCPFSGERLERVLDALELIAKARQIRVCCVDLPLPSRAWLAPATPLSGDVVVYCSRRLE